MRIAAAVTGHTIILRLRCYLRTRSAAYTVAGGVQFSREDDRIHSVDCRGTHVDEVGEKVDIFCWRPMESHLKTGLEKWICGINDVKLQFQQTETKI